MDKQQIKAKTTTSTSSKSNVKSLPVNKKKITSINRSIMFSRNKRRQRNRRHRRSAGVKKKPAPVNNEKKGKDFSDNNGFLIIKEGKKNDGNRPKTDFDVYVEIKKKKDAQLLSKVMELKDYIEVPGSDVFGGTYTRVVIIGDSFLSTFSKLWPSKSNIKPYFLYKNKLSVDELLKFRDHQFLKNSDKILVLFMTGLHDFTEYGTLLKASCTGNHLFTEYIKGLKSIDRCWPYFQKMFSVKENYEMDKSLSVIYSYFPNLQNVRNLRDIFNTSEEDIPNCTCLCQKLGDVPGELVEAEFNKVNKVHNQRAMSKQINAIKDKGVFEYMMPHVSFVNGNWRLAKAAENSEDDVSILNCLLNEFVFDVDYVDVLDQTKSDGIKDQVSTMRSRIIRSRYRIVVVGDKWIDCVACQWKSSQRVCPFFYFADNLNLNDLQKMILSLVKTNEIGLVITAIPSGELFTMQKSTSCKDHEALTYPMPNEKILINPINYAYQLIEKMNGFLQEIKRLRRYCGVVFMTCYPVQFSSYYEHLTEAHVSAVGETAHSNSVSPIDIDCINFDTQVSRCTDIINQYIQTSNEVQKVPMCNIAEIVKTAGESFAFPTFIEKKYPSKALAKELFKCMKTYIESLYDMCVSRKLSFTQTEEYVTRQNKYKYSEAPRRDRGRRSEGKTNSSTNDKTNKRRSDATDALRGNKRARMNITASKPQFNSLMHESNKSLQPQNMASSMPHLSQSFTNNGPLRSFMAESLPDVPPVNYIRSLGAMNDQPNRIPLHDPEMARVPLGAPEISRVPLRNFDPVPYDDNQRSMTTSFGFNQSMMEYPMMPREQNPENPFLAAREPTMMQRTNNFNNIRVLGQPPM